MFWRIKTCIELRGKSSIGRSSCGLLCRMRLRCFKPQWYAGYHEEHLVRFLSQFLVYPPLYIAERPAQRVRWNHAHAYLSADQDEAGGASLINFKDSLYLLKRFFFRGTGIPGHHVAQPPCQAV